jgi:2-iminobutanoate/2-iminopropanoate deaminase
MRTAIHTDTAPAAIGPYSQAICSGHLLWCSGQLGVDPGSGQLVGEDTASQAMRALDNLEAVCQAAGTRLDLALRCTVYLVDLADFTVVNAIYEKRFSAPFPARVTVQVAALPRGGRVEIDAVVQMS